MPNSIPDFAPIPTEGSSKSQQAHTPSGGAASLSMGHNCADQREAHLLDQSGAEQNLPFKLTGSQAKTAFALRHNAEQMIKAAGIAMIVFATLTLGERDQFGEWVKVHDGKEASRRFHNLARHVLPLLYSKWIVVTERHKDGGIHFHLLAVARGDVRTGVDIEALKDGEYSSATETLAGIWEVMRSEDVTRLGFGRCEAMPVYSCAEAVATYCSKYIEKNICNRMKSDKGQRLVRYGGWEGSQLKPNEFCWATPKACEWRRKVQAIAASAGIMTKERMAATIGPRWAWRATGAMFDLKLGDWAKLQEPIWHEGMMTRDEQELARDFLGRDAESFRRMAGRGSMIEARERAFERQMTEAEMERLRYDLEDLSHWREAEGLGDVDYAWTKGGRA